MELEHKFCRFDAAGVEADGLCIQGYASVFGTADQGSDVVVKGAYAASLKRLSEEGRRVKMLWQHDPAQPIGVWDAVHEDERGLFVKGRLLESVAKGREAAELIAAGAIDGLSIGYRTVRASKDEAGCRLLKEVELWEVSLVTFPMLQNARVSSKGEAPQDADLRDLAGALQRARRTLNGASGA